MSASRSASESKTSWLDRAVLSSFNLDVEKTLYLLFIVLAILTRFWALGDCGMSHDESLHTYYSWSLFKGGGFSHTPLMHGPFLFHINALIYSLLGADDFTSRISVAIFGVVLVGLPYFMRRWLGRTGGLVTSFMLLVSPSIWYHGRYIRDEAYMLVWIVLIAWGIFAYLQQRSHKWLYLMAGALAFGFLSMEATCIIAVIFGFFVAVAALIELSKNKDFWIGILGRSVLGLAVAALFAIGVVGLQAWIMGAVGLGPGDAMPFPQPPQPLQPGLPIEFSAQFAYWQQMAGGTAKVLLFTLIPAIVVAVVLYFWFKFILVRPGPGPGRADQHRGDRAGRPAAAAAREGRGAAGVRGRELPGRRPVAASLRPSSASRTRCRSMAPPCCVRTTRRRRRSRRASSDAS